MLNYDAKEEVFFDTVEYLSSEESVGEREDLVTTELGYEVWMCEPQSVKERREHFIRDMGLLEFSPSCERGLERLRECSGAVSSSCELLYSNVEENTGCCERDLCNDGSWMAVELGQNRMDLSVAPERKTVQVLVAAEQIGYRQSEASIYVDEDVSVEKKKAGNLWKSFKINLKRNLGKDVRLVTDIAKARRLKVRQNNKKCMEFSAVYVGQEFRAHRGLIRTMKFSPDGQYLASGGEDGVVRIWRVSTACTSCKSMHIESDGHRYSRKAKSSFVMKKSSHSSVVIPDTDFQMEELPLQELHGHTSDILDLSWSNSNCLLSSSKDKTVRLWQVGYDGCAAIFHHNNYVTCTQFNPVDENYFISGSIDGKVRIWGIAEKRVVDWVDVRDVITAVCYHPNGKRFAVGLVSGSFCFYDALGSDLLLTAEFYIHGKKRCSGNRITGIQFLEEDSEKVMITSEDSKIRIFDGTAVIHKYRGLSNSGSQTSASFTSTGRHIISVGEDSHIYIWNYDDTCVPSKHTNSIRSCEHFFHQDVSVAIPWSNRDMDQNHASASPCCCSPKQDHQDSTLCTRDSERFSLANWFFLDGSFRRAATWPEEKLPLCNVAAEQDHQSRSSHDNHCNISQNASYLSATWGLVIVTAGPDGMIRTFHNYGLPLRK